MLRMLLIGLFGSRGTFVVGKKVDFPGAVATSLIGLCFIYGRYQITELNGSCILIVVPFPKSE